MPKMREFTTAQREEIRKQAIAFKLHSYEKMSPFYQMVTEVLEPLCRVQLPKELEQEVMKHEDRAALVPTNAFVNVKSTTGEIMRMLFGEKQYATLSIQGQPNRRTEQVDKAEAVLQSICDTCAGGRGLKYEARRITRGALQNGLMAGIVSWEKRYERFPLRDPKTHELVTNNGYPVFQEKLVYENPNLTAVDIRRVFIDMRSEDERNDRLVGWKSLVPLSELIRLRDSVDVDGNPNSHYDFDEKKLKKDATINSYFDYLPQEHNDYNNQGTTFGDAVIQTWSMRGLFNVPLEDGRTVQMDLIVEIASESELIALKANDLPIRGWNVVKYAHVFDEISRRFPMGQVEPAVDLIVEKFIKRNQSLDAAGHFAHPMYIADKSAMNNGDIPDYIEVEGGKIIQVDTTQTAITSVREAFAPLEHPTGTQDTFVQAQFLDKEIDEAMGKNEYTKTGGSSGAPETATGVDALVTAGTGGIQEMAENLVDSIWNPVFRDFLVLWNFFKGHKQNIITDARGNTHDINPGELDFIYNVDIEFSPSLDKQAMIRRFVEAFPVISARPNYDQYELDRMFVNILKLPNPDKILLPNEHQQIVIDRENAALMQGVEQQVSPQDAHTEHIQSHIGLIDMISAPQAAGLIPQEALADIIEGIEEHIIEHQGYIEQMNQALGNTKEMGGGTGNLVQPDGAAIKQFSPLTGQRR